MFKTVYSNIGRFLSPKAQFSSKTFGSLNELQGFLKNEKPVLSCMYFRAKWNPM